MQHPDSACQWCSHLLGQLNILLRTPTMQTCSHALLRSLGKPTTGETWHSDWLTEHFV
jgi:hypothetical protein